MQSPPDYRAEFTAAWATMPWASWHSSSLWCGRLLGLYGSPQRYYHGLWHLCRGLELLKKLDLEEERLATLAWFFHDAVYEPGAPSGLNEVASSLLLPEFCAYGSFDSATERDLAMEAIMDTMHTSVATTERGRLVQDVDLIGLADPWPEFDQHQSWVRSEFHHLSYYDFAAGSVEVLAGFAAKPKIYTSGHFDDAEARARANIAKYIDQACERFPELRGFPSGPSIPFPP